MRCLSCPNEFDERLNKKYCSPLCQRQAKARRSYLKRLAAGEYDKKKHSLICKQCSNSFLCKRRIQQFCSPKCASLAKKKYLDIPSCLENPERKIDKHIGYVRIYVPMHKEANTWGYVYEHRIVAEQILGRLLTKDEIVHHKNGKRWDNRPENLEVMNKKDHAKLHGQREITCLTDQGEPKYIFKKE